MEKKNNALVNRILLAANVILLCLSTAPHATNFFPFFDLFSHFRPHLFIISGISLLFTIFFNLHVAFILTLIALVANASALAPLFQMSVDTIKNEKVFKVGALNIQWDRNNCSTVKKYVASLRFDFIGIIEATPKCQRELKTLRDVFPHIWFAEPSSQVAGVSLHGIGVLSRYPWINIRQLESPLVSRRYAVATELKTKVGSLAIIVAHFIRPIPPWPGDWRNSQDAEVRDLVSYLGKIQGKTILLGDLNAAPFGLTFRQLRAAGLELVKGSGWATWPDFLGPLGLAIDHILVSSGLEGTMRIGDNIGSDHLPVLGEINLKVPVDF